MIGSLITEAGSCLRDKSLARCRQTPARTWLRTYFSDLFDGALTVEYFKKPFIDGTISTTWNNVKTVCVRKKFMTWVLLGNFRKPVNGKMDKDSKT